MLQTLKEILLEGDNIIEILEDLDFTGIRVLGDEIRCALPDGDNETSVSISLSPQLYTNVYTRPEFSDYQVQDFISLISYATGLNFTNTVEYLASKLGLSESDFKGSPVLVKFLNKFKCKDKICLEDRVYGKELISQYPNYIVDEWVEEGITSYTQMIYDIRRDEDRNRWLLPAYNQKGELVTMQGRSYLDYKELGIPKYIFYRLGGDTVLNYSFYGLNQAYDYIKEKNEVIIFEGAKSVMKAYEYGYYNAVAIQGSIINDGQINTLLSLGADVILALDNDKRYKDIKKELDKMKFFLNTFYIMDIKKRLEDKDSPVDKGKEIFNDLYSERKRFG